MSYEAPDYDEIIRTGRLPDGTPVRVHYPTTTSVTFDIVEDCGCTESQHGCDEHIDPDCTCPSCLY